MALSESDRETLAKTQHMVFASTEVLRAAASIIEGIDALHPSVNLLGTAVDLTTLAKRRLDEQLAQPGLAEVVPFKAPPFLKPDTEGPTVMDGRNPPALTLAEKERRRRVAEEEEWRMEDQRAWARASREGHLDFLREWSSRAEPVPYLRAPTISALNILSCEACL